MKFWNIVKEIFFGIVNTVKEIGENFHLMAGNIINIATLTIMTLMTALFFRDFGYHPIEKFLMVCLAIIFEISRRWLWKDILKKLKHTTPVLEIIIYTGLSLVSVVGGVTYLLTTLEKTSFESSKKNSEVVILERSIKFAEEQIELLDKRIAGTPSNYTITFTNLQAEKIRFQSELNSNTKALNVVVNTTNHQTIVSDSFTVLAKSLPWVKAKDAESVGRSLKAFLFFVLLTLIELLFIITSGSPEKFKIKESKSNVISFIDNCQEEGAGRLNSMEKIAKATNLPIDEVRRIARMLSSEVKFKGTPVLQLKHGGSKLNFSKNNAKIIVDNYSQYME